MSGIGIGIGVGRGEVSGKVIQTFASGLVLNLDARHINLADGALVSSWSDAIGQHTATGSGSTRPTFDVDGWSDGGPAVSFNGASSNHLRVDSVAALSNHSPGPGPFAVAALIRPTSVATATQAYFGLGSSTDYRAQAYLASATVSSWAHNPGQNGTVFGSDEAHTDEDTLVMHIFDGASSVIYTNGQRTNGSLLWNPWTDATTAAIGGVPGSGGTPANYYTGLIRRLMVWNSASGDARWSAAVQALHAHAIQRHRLFGLGDSITAGYGIAGNASWLNTQALPLSCLGAGSLRAAPINKAENGRSLVATVTSGSNNIYDNLATDLPSSTYSGYVPSVIVLFCGSNDCVYGKTVNETIANYWMVSDAIRAARPLDYLVAVTPLRRVGFVTEMDGLAAGIRANWRSHASTLWDPNVMAEFADPANATWFQDGVHPTDTGHSLLKNHFAALNFRGKAVNAMLARLLG